MIDYEPDDRVFAALELFNDPLDVTGKRSIPGLNPGDLLAPAGTRDMVINVNHVETAPADEP